MFGALSMYLALCFLASVGAQSRVSQTVTTALSNSTTLSGQAVKLPPFDISIVTNETFAMITFNLTDIPVEEVGWIGFGTGTRMSNADMFIAWPFMSARKISWVFSSRTAGGHQMPDADPNMQHSEFLGQAQLSTTELGSTPYTLLSILRPLRPQYETEASAGNILERGKVDVIYAYSSVNPDSIEADAPITSHAAAAAIEMDLSRPLKSTIISSQDATGQDSSGSEAEVDEAEGGLVPEKTEQIWTSTDTVVCIHALIGTLAWVVVSPSAILLARFGRNLPGWVKVHQFLQSGLTGSLTIGSFILGIMASSSYSSAHFATSHQTIGLVLLLLLVFQASLGFYIHHLYDVNRIKRPVRNFLHIGLGLITTILGFVQLSLGFAAYAEKGRITPTAIKVIVYILEGGFAATLLFSYIRFAVQRRSPKPLMSTPSRPLQQCPPVSLYELNADGKQGWESFENKEKSYFQ